MTGSGSAFPAGDAVGTSLRGPRGGSTSYADLSPAEARRLARQLIDSADDVESGLPVLWWTVKLVGPEPGAEPHFRSLMATRESDAVARAVAARNADEPGARIVSIEKMKGGV